MRPAVEAVIKIIDDLSSRRGLSDEWENIDADVQEEIKNSWTAIIVDAMSDFLAENK